MTELSAYYYIAPGSLSIVPNANNSPNDIAVSIASSASIMVFAPRIHNDLNWDGTNYRVWRLTAGNTRLGSEHADKIVYIYARLSRSAPTAEIIFTSVRHTANARQEAQTDANGDPILDGDGNEVMQTVYDEQYIKMSSDEASFWVRIGLLTAPDENNRRELEYDSGQLGTPKGDADKNETGLNVMWVYDSTAKVMRAQVPIGAKTQGGEVRFVDPVRIDYTVRFGANGVKLNGVSTSIGDNPNESNITSADDRLIATKGFSFARFIKRAGDTLDAFFNFLGGMKIGKTSGADPALLVEGGTETDTLEVTDNAHIDTLDVENDASVGGDVAVGGRLDVTGDATAANVHAVDADGTYGNVIGKHLAATEDGRTGGDVVGLTVGNFTPSIDGIGGEGGGMIEVTEQLTDDEGNPRVDEQNNPLMGKFSSLDVDYLTVRRRAFFTNITVKELKHVGGEIILSPAAMICYAVEELRDAGATLVGWRCYFKASDTEGRKLHQEFEVGDQARCQMFDIDPGTSKYVSTRYYWRYVRGVSVEAVDLTLERDGESETVKCHYIDLSFSDRDPGCSNVNKSGIPQPGDNISQLGNRSNVERQSAQILSAVGMYAPSHTYYQHINSYSLGSEKIVKQSYYDPTTGRMKDFVGDEHNYMRWTGTSLDIKGNLSTSSGKNVDNVLTEHERQIQGLGVNMSNVNAQADQRFQVWFDYDGIVPTLQNEPAVNWDTVELLTLHNQDIYYSCRILSDNDTPDDPSDDELSADGRAWRFDYTPPAASSSSSSSEEDEGSSSSSSSSSDDDTPSIPGTARWVEITDQFALQGLRNAAIADRKAMTAQETVDNLADDNIISAGAEKSRLLKEWKQAVDEWQKYNLQASDHQTALAAAIAAEADADILSELNAGNTGLTTALSAFNAAWKHLAHYLDGDLDGDAEWDLAWAMDEETGNPVTPRWLNADFTIDTCLGSVNGVDTGLGGAARYREKWNDYYASLTSLIRAIAIAAKAISNRAQATADAANASIADIVSDGKLTVDELPDLKREFEAAYRQRAEMVDLATYDSGANQYKIIDSSLTSPLEAYLTAFTNLTTYLNMASGAWTEPTTSPTYAVTYANGNTPGSYRVGAKSPLVTADFPALLKVSATTEFKSTWGSGGTADSGAAFRNLWAALATAQVKLANAMATLSKNAADAADQKAQAAQDAVDLLADDGTISGGDEKSKLYIEWQRVLNERTQYMEQVDDYTNATTGRLTILASTAKVSSTNRTAASTAKTSLTNLYAAYETAIINLGKYLDGMIANGSYSEGAGDFYNGGTVSWNTLPAIIKDDAARATDTTPISATTYRARWDTYYTALKDLFTALSDAAMLCVRVSQETGNSALTRIDEILSDGVIDVGEKSEVLADFLNAWNRMHISGGLRDRARDANGNFFPSVTIGGVTYNCSAAYNSWLAAFDALGEYLSGNQWDSRELNPDAQTNLISADDEGLPYEINDGDGGLSETMDVTPSEYRAVWSGLYNAETKMETVVAKVTKYIADAAKEGVDNIFSDDILTPEELRVIRREFHAMCLEWMRPNTGLVAQAQALQASSSNGFELDWGDWLDLSELGTFLNNGNEWNLSTISITNYAITEADTPSWIKTANIENSVVLTTAIVTVRSNWPWTIGVLKDGNNWLGGRAAFEKFWRMAHSETEQFRKEIDEERAAQAASSAVNTVNTDTTAALYQLAQSAYNRTGQRCQVFSGSTRPTNYKIGDLWINATTTTAIAIWDPDKSGGAGAVNKKLTGQTMVCWTTGQDSVRSSFTAGDWQELDHYVHSWIKQQSDAIMLGIEATGDEDPETGTLATKFNAIELDINGIKAITENITLDGNGKISQINQSGIVVQSNFATLFSQRMTAEHVATTSQITAAADGIKLEVKADVEEDINPGDNLFQYAELGDISTLIEYWTLRTQGNADAAAATAALYGVSSPIFSVKSATREGWPILEMNMRRSVLTNTTGSPHVDIEQIVPSAVLKATGASSFTVSIYVKRNGDYSDRAFGFFVDNCAGFTTSSGDDPSNVTISQQNVNLSGNLYYTQFYIGDNEWHRLWVTFSVYSINADTKIYFRSWKTRDTSNGSVWYLSCPKLEAGTKPTRWIVERSVIDITKNQIVLDSKTVKVAKDLTIGGNAHIGGFIFNDAVTLTPDKVKVCFNPFDFGLMDRSLAKEGFQHNIPPYLTNNVIFPDFGSSIVIDENVASVFRDPDTVPHRDRLQIMLPFWHFYNVDHNNPMDYPAQIASNVAAWYWTDGTLDTDGVSLKKFYFNTYPDKNTKRLWDFMVNGYSVCLKYIDTVVTIVNALDENDYGDNDVWIFGAKGVVDGEYGFTHYNTLNLGSIVDFFELEPWNRGTIRWSIADYYSGNYSTHRFASSYAWPRLDEAKAIIANDSYRTLDYMSHRVSSGSWHATNRQYDNDTVWINASQLGQEEDFTDIDGTSNDLMAGATLVSGSNCCPFILPKGYFVRLKCVFRDGFFFWEPIDFGAIDTN